MSFWSFWVPVGLLSLVVVGFAVLGLARGARLRGPNSDDDDGEAREVRVYAQQLREIERDVARGLVSEGEAERMRTETARRLLAADKAERKATGQSPGAMRWTVVGAALAIPLAAYGIYTQIGTSGLADMPMIERLEAARVIRETRPSQTELEARFAQDLAQQERPEPEPEYLALMERLREVVAERPTDTQGLRLLAVNEGNMGNFTASAQAWVRLVEVQGESAPFEDLESLIEAMIRAAGGYVSPQTEVVLERLLRRDPRNGLGRYYLGLMFAQTERPDLTFRIWRGLLEDSSPGDPWVANLRGSLAELAQIAGVRYTLPPEAGTRGPTAADMAAAADMTPEERQQMIGGMVEGLAARLANEGGTPAEWARLIGALGALGQSERAAAIWGEAQTTFADRPEAIAEIAAAARQAGLIE